MNVATKFLRSCLRSACVLVHSSTISRRNDCRWAKTSVSVTRQLTNYWNVCNGWYTSVGAYEWGCNAAVLVLTHCFSSFVPTQLLLARHKHFGNSAIVFSWSLRILYLFDSARSARLAGHTPLHRADLASLPDLTKEKSFVQTRKEYGNETMFSLLKSTLLEGEREICFWHVIRRSYKCHKAVDIYFLKSSAFFAQAHNMLSC